MPHAQKRNIYILGQKILSYIRLRGKISKERETHLLLAEGGRFGKREAGLPQVPEHAQAQMGRNDYDQKGIHGSWPRDKIYLG